MTLDTFLSQLGCDRTQEKYAVTLASFGSAFETAGSASNDRYRYADSLVHFGLLERRVIQLKDADGRLRGSRIEFRRA